MVVDVLVVRVVDAKMAFIITSSCIGTTDGACVDVCPVDCIYSKKGDNHLFINPDECIDCAACEPVCPVDAIFPDDEVPENESAYIEEAKNYDYDSSEPGNNL